MTTQTPGAQDHGANSSETVPPRAPTGLTIGELAARTGVAAPTLRMWETRHGFPRAERLASGHRRYDQGMVAQVEQVQRQRDAGVRLEAAIASLGDRSAVQTGAVYPELRRRHPHLQTQRLRKSTLLALTWALEDECCARAQRPYLFGAFQAERYYRQAERRWRDLARTSAGAYAFAYLDTGVAQPDEGDGAAQPPFAAPALVSLPPDAAMTREWSLVCLAPDFPAALAAWELPGQDTTKDGDRLFESIWTLEPRGVADAARICAEVARDLGHDTAEALRAADAPVSPAAYDLAHAANLFGRVMAYADQRR